MEFQNTGLIFRKFCFRNFGIRVERLALFGLLIFKLGHRSAEKFFKMNFTFTF